LSHRYFVLTGGPGAGKSSLIAALARSGHHHMPEAGRAIIRAQQAIGGDALPWRDRAAFAELMLSWDMRSHAEAMSRPGPVLFDRGIPDVVGYLRLCGLPAPAHVLCAAMRCRYHRRVFLAPYWPKIFTQDAERRQDPAEAEATCQMMARTYAALGYEIVPLPRASIAERTAFVAHHIAAAMRED